MPRSLTLSSKRQNAISMGVTISVIILTTAERCVLYFDRNVAGCTEVMPKILLRKVKTERIKQGNDWQVGTVKKTMMPAVAKCN